MQEDEINLELKAMLENHAVDENLEKLVGAKEVNTDVLDLDSVFPRGASPEFGDDDDVQFIPQETVNAPQTPPPEESLFTTDNMDVNERHRCYLYFLSLSHCTHIS